MMSEAYEYGSKELDFVINPDPANSFLVIHKDLNESYHFLNTVDKVFIFHSGKRVDLKFEDFLSGMKILYPSFTDWLEYIKDKKIKGKNEITKIMEHRKELLSFQKVKKIKS